MPYLIETFDKPGHQQLRRETRDEHLRFLEANKALLLACGAKLADDGRDLGGGLYVVDLENTRRSRTLHCRRSVQPRRALRASHHHPLAQGLSRGPVLSLIHARLGAVHA